jgi:6-phosphogluconolactonase
METPLTQKSKIEVRILPDLEALSREAGALLVELANDSIASKGRFVVALSGGVTPRRMYSLLGGTPFRDQVDWGHVHFFWTDERCVPEGDEASNFKRADDLFLSKVLVPKENIHRMKGEEEPAKAAEDYEREIREFFGKPGYPNFDLVLLGLGEDGHTASLFPESESLHEKRKLVIPIYLKRPSLNRITLSLPVLNSAKDVLFLVAGESKVPIIRKVLGEGGHKESYPAGLIQPVNGKVTWLIDQEAASKLITPLYSPLKLRGE